MKIDILSTTVLLLSFAFAPAFGDISGDEIMKEVDGRHDSTSELTTELVLLVDKNGNKEQRLMTHYSKDISEDEQRFLAVFMEPAAVRGTALLTWSYKNRDSDQWIFLPAQKKMRRIASGSKKGYFMGTDLTYEDLYPEEIDKFRYAVLREEAYGGQACWVLEAVPNTADRARDSGYGKRILWIRKDIYFTVRIDFFDKRGELIKTRTNHDVACIRDDLWRFGKSLVVNNTNGHKTLMIIQSREVDGAIGEEIFTEHYVVAGRHVR